MTTRDVRKISKDISGIAHIWNVFNTFFGEVLYICLSFHNKQIYQIRYPEPVLPSCIPIPPPVLTYESQSSSTSSSVDISLLPRGSVYPADGLHLEISTSEESIGDVFQEEYISTDYAYLKPEHIDLIKELGSGGYGTVFICSVLSC